MKKFLSSFLAVIILMTSFSTLSVTVKAFDNKCGENITWSIDLENGILTLSGSGEMYDYSTDVYSYNTAPWYGLRSGGKYVHRMIKTIKISQGITKIGKAAFYNCVSLENITLPNSIESIGSAAFYECLSLKNIIIPDSVNNIGGSAFAYCEALENLYISKNISRISDWTFIECNNLKNIVIPENVTEIGSLAFKGCDNLEKIQLPFKLKTIGKSAFSVCKSLKTIIIPPNVEQISGYAFGECDSLKEVKIFSMNVEMLNDQNINGGFSVPHTFAGNDNHITTIYGYENSTAEKYVKDYPDYYKFIILDEDYSANPEPVLPTPFKQLYFNEEPIILLDVGESKTLNVHSRDVANINGQLVYSNDTPIDNTLIDWNTELLEDTGIIKVTDDGKITGLSKGYANLSIHLKDDLNLSTFCHVFVGSPTEMNYTATYDTKQYYAEGGFFSEVSSISDCVELYLLLENKM